jgi:serine/threonine protein kinase
VTDDRESGTAEDSRTDLERGPAPTGETAARLQSGTVLGGRYEIRRVVGRGGMGVVAEALDRTLGEAVAIKIVRAEYTGERCWAERLAREVKLARQIHHPNVCRVFDFAQADGRVFLIMELTSHGSLRDEINSGAMARRPLGDRVADVRALAAGLGAIHEAGILHRDVTPQNVLRMADGRVVLSDFGLATDSFEGTTSVHGGTIAYMAPELVRGGRASVASDVWALGVVAHEIVFGERPHWRPGAHEMSTPVAGRRLSRAERAVLEICRACTAENPERRPRQVSEIAARLSVNSIRRASWRRWGQRVAAVACLGLVTLGLVLGGHRLRARAASSANRDPLLIVPTGEPEDWTDKSRVLAEVPEKIRCTSLLPDHRTIRFVWGSPPHAEDVDTHTGQRRPSPLVPAAYAEGCPDVSPDGQRIVYAGHTPDNRAFAFVSTHADGSHGVPMVPTAEPTMKSDPTWMSDGQSFSYDADVNNMAVFSLITNRSLILPHTSPTLGTSSFRYVLNKQILTTTSGEPFGTEVVGWSWPSLNEERRFHFPGIIYELRSRDERTYYCLATSRSDSARIVEIDSIAKTARNIGAIRGQGVTRPSFVEDGLAFLSGQVSTRVTVRDSRGIWSPVSSDQFVWEARSCGPDIVASVERNNSSTLVRLNRQGRVLKNMTTGPHDFSPNCSADGESLFYLSFDAAAFNGAIKRCGSGGCRTLLEGGGSGLAISPDDERLAFLYLGNKGVVVRWMSTEGGEVHDVAETETACAPEWSSNRTLWISRRRGQRPVWTEVDADTGKPTGKVAMGLKECTSGENDPASPASPDVRVTVERKTQLRLLPRKYLPAG